MKKVFGLAPLVCVCAALTFAQSTNDYDRVNIFAGFSQNRVNTTDRDLLNIQAPAGFNDAGGGIDLIDNRRGFNGFNASVTGSVSRYVGLKFDSSAHYDSDRIRANSIIPCLSPPCQTSPVDFELRSSLYNFLGGVQVRDNAKSASLKPFAHVLVGAAHARSRVDEESLNRPCVLAVGAVCPGVFQRSDTGLAGAFGGGLDFRLSDRVDLRAVQLDYNPVRIDGATRHNFRIGVGIVFR